jgi:hypothetical protein
MSRITIDPKQLECRLDSLPLYDKRMGYAGFYRLFAAAVEEVCNSGPLDGQIAKIEIEYTRYTIGSGSMRVMPVLLITDRKGEKCGIVVDIFSGRSDFDVHRTRADGITVEKFMGFQMPERADIKNVKGKDTKWLLTADSTPNYEKSTLSTYLTAQIQAGLSLR